MYLYGICYANIFLCILINNSMFVRKTIVFEFICPSVKEQQKLSYRAFPVPYSDRQYDSLVNLMVCFFGGSSSQRLKIMMY